MSHTVDSSLLAWPDIRETFRNSDVGLLLGNGFSQAVWRDFSYASLYDLACDPSRDFPLFEPQQAIFQHMQTSNFEHVLWSLATSSMVCKFLGKEHREIDDHYQHIRMSLIHAVRNVHVPYSSVTDFIKNGLMTFFRNFDYIYTTNYDLLLYWVIMNDDKQFKDFLWYNRFNPADSHVWGNVTKVLYLHGALHLYHDMRGNTIKKENDLVDGDILTQFYSDPSLVPLFVSEGDSEDKLRSIRRNDYLSFAYWKLAYHRGQLVVFGNSLSDKFDKHIIDAMKNWKNYDRSRYKGSSPQRQVAISVYPTMPLSEIVAEKNRLSAALPACDLFFFDSTTHALGKGHLSLNPTDTTEISKNE